MDHLFLLGADKDHYCNVKAALDNNYLLGKQKYPHDLLTAKRLAVDFKRMATKPKNKSSASTGDIPGVFFVQ